VSVFTSFVVVTFLWLV